MHVDEWHRSHLLQLCVDCLDSLLLHLLFGRCSLERIGRRAIGGEVRHDSRRHCAGLGVANGARSTIDGFIPGLRIYNYKSKDAPHSFRQQTTNTKKAKTRCQCCSAHLLHGELQKKLSKRRSASKSLLFCHHRNSGMRITRSFFVMMNFESHTTAGRTLRCQDETVRTCFTSVC